MPLRKDSSIASTGLNVEPSSSIGFEIAPRARLFENDPLEEVLSSRPKPAWPSAEEDLDKVLPLEEEEDDDDDEEKEDFDVEFFLDDDEDDDDLDFDDDDEDDELLDDEDDLN